VSAIVDLLLGVITSIGGFVEAGSISTSAQAGSEFGFQLLWAIAAATIMLAMLAEMSGRLAAVSGRSVAAAVRERFGIHFHAISLAAEFFIDVLLLAAEIGGVAIALKLLTGVGFQWWILPVGLLAWLALWLLGFAPIEYGLGLLGLVTLSFVYAAWQLGPDMGDVGASFVPSLPTHHYTRYAFLAVSIVGATISPYLLNFYSSGAIEEKMSESELWVNRSTAYLGMCFGGVVSMGILVASATVLGPRHIIVDSYEQAALMLVPVFKSWAVPVFAASLAIGCFGAAVELSLNVGYVLSQAFGWTWGANKPRRDAARFTTAIAGVLLASVAIGLLGLDPLRLTLFSVALTVVIMPIVVLPFLVLMNDERFVKRHKSTALGNGVLAALVIIGAIMAVVVIPLEWFGG
jgi:Mn2+/Fe2+ NRAMP family transporter